MQGGRGGTSPSQARFPRRSASYRPIGIPRSPSTLSYHTWLSLLPRVLSIADTRSFVHSVLAVPYPVFFIAVRTYTSYSDMFVQLHAAFNLSPVRPSSLPRVSSNIRCRCSPRLGTGSVYQLAITPETDMHTYLEPLPTLLLHFCFLLGSVVRLILV